LIREFNNCDISYVYITFFLHMEARQIQTTEPVLQIIRRAYRHYQPNATVSLCTGRIDRPMSESGGAADFSAQSSTDASVSNFLHGQKMYHIRRASDVLH